LLIEEGGRRGFARRYRPEQSGPLLVQVLEGGPAGQAALDPEKFAAEIDRSALDSRQVGVLLVVPPEFARQLEQDGQPILYVLHRETDDHSAMVARRMTLVLLRWKRDLTAVRLVNRGLPASFQDAFIVHDPDADGLPAQRQQEGMFSLLVRVFPFILV